MFLMASGVGSAALLVGCASTSINATEPPLAQPSATTVPAYSPAQPGMYQTSRIILGEDAGTTAMPQPFQPGGLPDTTPADLPTSVLAAVYYPNNTRDHRPVPTPNPLHLGSGPFPLLLYAHAFRSTTNTADATHPAPRDFTTIGTMLSHVATYGCICVAPDLSWLPEMHSPAGPDEWNQRAIVLVNYFSYLVGLNDALFAQQLDATRLILVGHSRGAGGATHAGRILTGFGNHPKSVAYGLIAPEVGGDSNSDIHDLLVLGGDIDTPDAGAGADAERAYTPGGTPKAWVTIPGANHFSYTDICDNDATVCADVQQAAGAYLAALFRFYALGDGNMRPYLTGAQMVEGLNVTGLLVQSAGFIPPPPRPTVSPITMP